jgi:hypothetical protein
MEVISNLLNTFFHSGRLHRSPKADAFEFRSHLMNPAALIQVNAGLVAAPWQAFKRVAGPAKAEAIFERNHPLDPIEVNFCGRRVAER